MLYAVDRQTGQTWWTYDARQDGGKPEFHGNAIVIDDLLIVPTDDRDDGGVGHVYAFDAMSGALRWKRQFRHGVMSDVIRQGESIVVVTLSDEIQALSAADGTTTWRFQAPDASNEMSSSTPALLEGRVFFGARNGHVYCLDAVGGKVRWKRSTGSRVSSSIVAIGDSVICGTADGDVLRISRHDGSIQARKAIGGRIVGRPVVIDGAIIVQTADGGVCALNQSLRQEQWRHCFAKSDGPATHRPVVLGDLLLLADPGKNLVVLHLRDGTIVRSLRFDSLVRSITALDDDLVVGTLGGRLYALALDQAKPPS